MNWFLRCAYRSNPESSLGYMAAGGQNWGFVEANSSGEPLVYPPPDGDAIKSSAHDNWWVGAQLIGRSWGATWTFTRHKLVFYPDGSIGLANERTRKLAMGDFPAKPPFFWWQQDDGWDKSVLVFKWEQK